VLIALFERTVGFYASLINVNAYHQPGVEAGKKAAEDVLKLQSEALCFLAQRRGGVFTIADIANGIERSAEMEHIYHILLRCSVTTNSDLKIICREKNRPAEFQFSLPKT
jgi:glucose-6-phosphate isomerase